MRLNGSTVIPELSHKTFSYIFQKCDWIQLRKLIEISIESARQALVLVLVEYP